MRDGGGPIRALWVVAAAGIEGERERELRGIDPLPHLGRRWCVAAWPRWPVAAVRAVLVAALEGQGGGGRWRCGLWERRGAPWPSL